MNHAVPNPQSNRLSDLKHGGSVNNGDAPRLVHLPLPKSAFSDKGLYFAGLSPESAMSIYQSWYRHGQGHKTLIEYAAEKIVERARLLEYPEDDKWMSYLVKLGINKNLCYAIDAQGFDDIRLTETPLRWVLDAMHVRHNYLRITLCIDSQGSDFQNDGTSDQEIPTAHGGVRTFETRGVPAGHVTLWKGTDRLRAERCWRGTPRQRGTFEVRNLLSRPPTDFGGKGSVYYFTPSIEGAAMYAQYVKKAYSPAGVCLVRLILPNKVIEKSKPCLLHYPSDKFKECLWLSRRGESLEKHPDVHKAPLIIAHTSKGISHEFARMKDCHQVSERNLVHFKDRSLMCQYVMSNGFLDSENISDCESRISIWDQTGTHMLPGLDTKSL